jgi:hypothetical protein
LTEIADSATLQNRPILNVAGTYYSLNDIKNIISLVIDKRVLFALSDAVISSPSIYHESYTADELNAQLNFQVLSFLSNNGKAISFRNKNKEIHVSNLFKNKRLFKNNKDIIFFVRENTDVDFENPTLFFKTFKTQISDY